MSCHTEGTPESDKLVKEHGERVAWFRADGPEATLERLRRGRLIDLDAPEKSLLLRKPLNEVKHGGGQKVVKGDQGYRALLAFIEDYARVMKDGYSDVKSLPAAKGPLRFGTDIWVKIGNTPDAWGDRLLQVDVHAWDAKKGAWEAGPLATTDRKVWGKGRLWQHNLTLLAEKGSERAKAWAERPGLPRGRYLLRAYLVGEKAEYVGEVEVSSAWPTGYGRMTVAEGARVRPR
jgi:hypothetical protein